MRAIGRAVTRVVAGVAGGRRLRVPAGRGTRPTSDRVREALFSALEAIRGPLDGASFLDLYAGSGAVGIEAASRGAGRVMCVESDPRALDILRANVQTVDVDVDVASVPVERLLRTAPSAPYDVVFVDPPYVEPVEEVLDLLAEHGWLAAGAVVAVERATRGEGPGWPPRIVFDRSRRYGDTTLWYGRRP